MLNMNIFSIFIRKNLMTREEKNERQRKLRELNNNLHTKKYEKTKSGFMMRTYRNMKSRCTGIQHKKAHLYLGKELLCKEDFYSWTKTDKSFNELFEYWERNGYDRKLTPSIDRIDSSIGYVMGNIRWITHSENSRLSNKKRKCF